MDKLNQETGWKNPKTVHLSVHPKQKALVID